MKTVTRALTWLKSATGRPLKEVGPDERARLRPAYDSTEARADFADEVR
jgi:hypothetical protein